MEMTRTMLAEGVYLSYLPARTFKTSVLSAQVGTPLQRDTAAAHALLTAVLRRGTVSYPDMGALSVCLDKLYGARIDYTVRKKGERQCVGFVASVIDDAFAPGGERLLEPVAALLGELICDPVTVRGRFVPAYFESEKVNLIDAIRSILNDKRDYASSRLLQEMCAGEAYGIPRLGDEATTEKLTLKKLHTVYSKLISTSRLELFYSGSADLKRVEQALLAAFSTLPRENVEGIPATAEHPARGEVKYVEEATSGNSCLCVIMPLPSTTARRASSPYPPVLNLRITRRLTTRSWPSWRPSARANWRTGNWRAPRVPC